MHPGATSVTRGVDVSSSFGPVCQFERPLVRSSPSAELSGVPSSRQSRNINDTASRQHIIVTKQHTPLERDAVEDIIIMY